MARGKVNIWCKQSGNFMAPVVTHGVRLSGEASLGLSGLFAVVEPLFPNFVTCTQSRGDK